MMGKTDNPAAHGLNEHHKRRLGVAMALLDAASARIRDLLDERRSPTAMTVTDRGLSQAERDRLHPLLDQVQRLAEQLARNYGLEKQRKDERRVIVAELSQMWTIAENCRPKRMKGMGPIPEATAHPLDEQLAAMLAAIQELMSITRGGRENRED